MILALKIVGWWLACLAAAVAAWVIACHHYQRTLPPARTVEPRHSLDYWESAVIPGQE